MKEQYYARFVSNEEYKDCLKTAKPFKANPERFILMVEPIEYFDGRSFNAHFLFKHSSIYSLTESDWTVLRNDDLRKLTLLIEHTEKNKPFYITFEGVNFYKVTDVRIDKEEKLVFFLQQMIDQIFIESNRSFMIMPFGNSLLNDFFKRHVREYLQNKMQIAVYRADDFNDNDVIIDTIYREIDKAEFVICEVSECNKNVFFEIGYAKGIRKELIFLLQRGFDHKFFDVAHIRRIDYDLDNPMELQEKLRDTIETIRGKR